MNPVRGGLPVGPDELAAAKLVAAALLMAYVQVRDVDRAQFSDCD
jgi:hypothetical protein